MSSAVLLIAGIIVGVLILGAAVVGIVVLVVVTQRNRASGVVPPAEPPRSQGPVRPPGDLPR